MIHWSFLKIYCAVDNNEIIFPGWKGQPKYWVLDEFVYFLKRKKLWNEKSNKIIKFKNHLFLRYIYIFVRNLILLKLYMNANVMKHSFFCYIFITVEFEPVGSRTALHPLLNAFKFIDYLITCSLTSK